MPFFWWAKQQLVSRNTAKGSWPTAAHCRKPQTRSQLGKVWQSCLLQVPMQLVKWKPMNAW